METVEQQKPTQKSKNQIPKGIGNETSQKNKERKNKKMKSAENVMSYEEYHINGAGDVSNAELVDKNEVLRLQKFGRFAIKRLKQLKSMS